MHVFDASSIIYAWDNYPIENFPPMWEWLSEQVMAGDFSISKVALDEVVKKSPECAEHRRAQ